MLWTGYIGLEYVAGTGSCVNDNEHPSLYKSREVSGLAINGTCCSTKLVVINKYPQLLDGWNQLYPLFGSIPHEI